MRKQGVGVPTWISPPLPPAKGVVGWYPPRLPSLRKRTLKIPSPYSLEPPWVPEEPESPPGNLSRLCSTIPAVWATPPAGCRVGLCCTPTLCFHPKSQRLRQAPPSVPALNALGPPFSSWDGTCSLSI
jgi:hypothetical protein